MIWGREQLKKAFESKGLITKAISTGKYHFKSNNYTIT